MGDSNFWAQINWYAAGTLALQVAFLVAAVWFAKNILKTVRSFQEQVGALLKLTIAPGASERQSEGATAKHSLGESSPYWLTPSETQVAAPGVAPVEKVESGPGVIASAWHGLGTASHRVGAWLNEPIGGQGVHPVRRVLRWLQSPAGTRPAMH